KPVIAYLKYASDREYYLATVADKIYLNPSASSGIILTGVGGNHLYYKDMFEKIGVEMQVIHAGKYKGYGENYTRNSMSEPIKQSLNNLIEDYYNELIEQISHNRGISRRELIKIYEKREEIFISQVDAVDLNLVDGLMYREKLLSDNSLSKDYLVPYTKYKANRSSVGKDKIAIVHAEGSITSVQKPFSQNVISAKQYVKTLKKIQNDESIKAVILRVNSPGGSALESDIINDKIMKLRASGKPVVVSMGNVAASGGYYISSNADYIFADPLTITGSIGVVMMYPNLEKLGKKIGLHSQTLKKGKYASFLNVWEPIDENTNKELENQINQTYKEFKGVVSKGRDLTLEEVEKVAQGRVWSSRTALSHKLIDEIGGLSKAIDKAASLANIQGEYTYKRFPEKKSVYEDLLSEKFSLSASIDILKTNVPEFDINRIKTNYEQIKAEPIQQRMLLNVE
ncbi:MAG: signal peptide peptidase SppA, partial [Candidatus Cloacimonadota bacterium]|nr:signal peptide peptidase SppA [Candidatus Cloacimonadota bacterium]